MRELKHGIAAMLLFCSLAIGTAAALVGLGAPWSLAVVRTTGHLTLTIRTDDEQGGLTDRVTLDVGPGAARFRYAGSARGALHATAQRSPIGNRIAHRSAARIRAKTSVGKTLMPWRASWPVALAVPAMRATIRTASIPTRRIYSSSVAMSRPRFDDGTFACASELGVA
jgi:hypothetical protein